jgi:CDP-diacylglycerol pyrophosphatase
MILRRTHVLASVVWLAATAFHTTADAADDPNALWQIVHDQCVPHDRQFATPLPCAAVDEAAGYAILKDRNGASQFLLIATARVSGIEDPAILAVGAPDYWIPAWRFTRLVEALVGHALPRESLSLAINSANHRTQNQFHIHLDCIRADVRDALRTHAARIGATWSPFPVPLAGHAYRAMRTPTLAQPGATPFQALASLADARWDMRAESLVAVGARFDNGDTGFYLLETKEGPGEELQDHGCAVAAAP